MHPGWDDDTLLTITARHFEAAYFGTPQILLKSEYKGLLKPGVHYIPVSKDLSNFEEVIPLVNDSEYLISTVEAIRNDIFKEEYTYEALRSQVVCMVLNFVGTGKIKELTLNENDHRRLVKHAGARLRVRYGQPNKHSGANIWGKKQKLKLIARKLLISLRTLVRYLLRRSRYLLRRSRYLLRRSRYLFRRSRYMLRRSYYLIRRNLIDTIKWLIR